MNLGKTMISETDGHYVWHLSITETHFLASSGDAAVKSNYIEQRWVQQACQNAAETVCFDSDKEARNISSKLLPDGTTRRQIGQARTQTGVCSQREAGGVERLPLFFFGR